MLVYLTIESDSSKWKLQANYDEIKKRYYGVSLANPTENNIWDSPEFLFNDLAPMVLHMNSLSTSILVPDYCTDVYQWLISNRLEIEELNEILQYAVGLGWGKIK